MPHPVAPPSFLLQLWEGLYAPIQSAAATPPGAKPLPQRWLLVAIALTFAASGPAAEIAFKINDRTAQTGLADAVVSLTPLDPPAAPNVSPGTPAEIVQENVEFAPYVTAITVGTPVIFPNRDTVQHHVYSVSKPKSFELPLYDPGKAETVVFDQPGAVVIGCNIHDSMSAHVLVVATPYFAKSGVDGVCRITAPPGRYRAEIWHPRLAKAITRELTVSDGVPTPTIEFSLTLRPDRRFRRGPASSGGGYR